MAKITMSPKMQKMVNKISDMRLNKSGSIGTEPIAKRDSSGRLRKYVQVKAGKLGGFDIPTRTTYSAEDDMPQTNRAKRAYPSYRKGGMVKKTGLAKLHKGERVLTTKQAKNYKK